MAIYGIFVGFDGILFGFLWNVFKVGFLWVFLWDFKGFLWNVFLGDPKSGIFMGFSWDCCGIFMGLLWEFEDLMSFFFFEFARVFQVFIGKFQEFIV